MIVPWKSFQARMSSFLFDKCLSVELLCHMVCTFNSIETSRKQLKVIVTFTFTPEVCEESSH